MVLMKNVIVNICRLIIVPGILMALISSCNSNYVPRPKGYFRISLPEHLYQKFEKPGFPYSFELPVYANVVQDSTYFDEQPENPYWINIDFPQFQGKIYISYVEIGGKSRFKVRGPKGEYIDSIGINTFDRLLSSSYNLTFKHSLKASSIDDSVFRTRNGVEGIFFKIGGNAATANQFLVTDSVKHFLRGALYFDATPNEDSLGIVNQFLQQDMKHMINTLKWTK
jgi:gliding motility-associated lipoprotein GldD